MAYIPRYDSVSPYGVTPIINRYMVYYSHRRVPPHNLDTIITINDERYVKRPDILANDIYGDPDLWWVIALRNGLQDPVFDLKMGTELTISHPSFVRTIV